MSGSCLAARAVARPGERLRHRRHRLRPRARPSAAAGAGRGGAGDLPRPGAARPATRAQPRTGAADVLDRGALRRALRDCRLVFHTAGYVGARPVERVWEMNALSPRLVVEAAASARVPRLVITSSVAGVGPVPPGRIGYEEDVYRGGRLGLTYVDAKHEGGVEALAAGARLGVEVVIVNRSYVFGVPVDRSEPGETSTRTIGNYLRGRLPAVGDAPGKVVDVPHVGAGHPPP